MTIYELNYYSYLPVLMMKKSKKNHGFTTLKT